MSMINNRFPTVALPGGMRAQNYMTDAAISGGMAFLVGELEKRDEKLYEPLSSITWPRDIPVKTGGGLVDSVAVFDVSYATTGGTSGGLIGGEANDLPIMQADIGKESARTFTWGHILKVPLVDQEKLQQIGRSLDEILDKGIHLAHDKKVDENVYVGFENSGSYGLVNNPTIAVSAAAPHTQGGTDTAWVHKTADEILQDINALMLDTWMASGYDVTGMANHILLPPAQYAHLVKTKVGVTGDKSILTFLLENNIGISQGVELCIAPCPFLIGAGANGSDRMVAYANAEDRVRFEMTSPLRRVMTQADVSQLAYLTPYMAQFSEVVWVYKQHARYMDGI